MASSFASSRFSYFVLEIPFRVLGPVMLRFIHSRNTSLASLTKNTPNKICNTVGYSHHHLYLQNVDIAVLKTSLMCIPCSSQPQSKLESQSPHFEKGCAVEDAGRYQPLVAFKQTLENCRHYMVLSRRCFKRSGLILARPLLTESASSICDEEHQEVP
jgi:hypothetical protein